MKRPDIVVIGTSAGGVAALQSILRSLPADFPAAIFVVMHLPSHSPSFLDRILARTGKLSCVMVHRRSRFKAGTVYVAPPDHHLILTRTEVLTNRGPRENWHRPSVDVLFRSAAQALGPRVVGVVLTGFLDDGAAGLAAIKQRGGVAVVQDPGDALFPDMPLNAMQNVRVDHCLPLSHIAETLDKVVRRPVADRPAAVSQEVAIETAIAKTAMNGRAGLEKIGKPSTFTCPECQGPLWELTDNGHLLRFRCQVGHAFSADSMMNAQQDVVERSLWVALGAIQSRVALWRRIADRMSTPHLKSLAGFYRAKEAEARRDLDELRALLTRNGDEPRALPGGSPRRASGASGASAARTRRARRAHTPGRSRRT